MGLFSILGNITFGPFVDELDDDDEDDEEEICDRSSVVSNGVRY